MSFINLGSILEILLMLSLTIHQQTILSLMREFQ
jgi:hypothetical protein